MEIGAVLRLIAIGVLTAICPCIKASHETDSNAAPSWRVDRSEIVYEERLRYARDSVERIYDRRVAVMDGLNYTLVAVIGFLVALLCVFVDKMCDFGWVAMAFCAALVVVTVWGLAVGHEELDADEFISDVADDPIRTLVSNTETILEEIRFVNRVLAKKRFRVAATGFGSAVLMIYVFLVKVEVLSPQRFSQEYCPTGIAAPSKGSTTGNSNVVIQR